MSVQSVTQLPPNVSRLLAELRRRIRLYLWLRGLALVAASLGLWFWLLVGLDWWFEPPREARLAMLGVAGLAAGYVAYRYLAERVFTPIADRNLALILERQFDSFGDTLLTAVELAEPGRSLAGETQQMLAQTSRTANQMSQGVDLSRVFNRRPLVSSVLLAAGVALSIALFAFLSPTVMAFAVARLTTATDASWPRQTHLAVEGFRDGQAAVARGGDFVLRVSADTRYRVPDTVEVRYRTEAGVRERKLLVREGNAVPGRDALQEFRYTFTGVVSPLVLDVRGGDARIKNLQLRVVESPSLAVTLDCRFPAYTGLAPRSMPATAASPIARGTSVILRAAANKPLVEARVRYDKSPGAPLHDLERVGNDPQRYQLALGRIDEDRTLSFELFDEDGIENRAGLEIRLLAVPDKPPEVAIRPRGISSAITPQARIPWVGQVDDDYGVSKVWIEHTVEKQPPGIAPLATPRGQIAQWNVDEATEVGPWKLKPGEKVSLVAKASDNIRPPEAAAAQTGQGERWLLDVVTADELRILLEARELNLRQRFESILAEVVQTRDALGEVAARLPDAAGDRDLDNQRVQRALQNSQKNAEEVRGIGDAFGEMHDELVNNRVDTPELRVRLKDRIAVPLEDVAGKMFPELDNRLKTLASDRSDSPAARESAQRAAHAQADAIVAEMQRVRDRMLELESFNEAIELLRAIISAQHNVTEGTKKERADKLRKLLEE